MNKQTFEFKPIAVTIPITNEQADDFPVLQRYIHAGMQAILYGHHAQGIMCCCARTFKTKRGTAQHARYQNKKHPAILLEQVCPIKI